MPARNFISRIKDEFRSRRSRNVRYSLRAFAAFLGTDHSTLSQVLRGKRPLQPAHIRSWGCKLALDREEILAYIAAEQAPDRRRAARDHLVTHWTAEAMTIFNEPIHWEMLRLSRQPHFRSDSRYVAAKLGVSVDQVNLALSRLLRLRLLQVTAEGVWSECTGARVLNEASFRRIALARVRQLAGEFHSTSISAPHAQQKGRSWATR